jgi:hypothetical protein
LISKEKSDGTFHFSISQKSDLINIIIPHFTKYPLKSSKAFSFLCFVTILNLYVSKNLTKTNIIKIINLIYVMNPGGKKKYSLQVMLELCSNLFYPFE